MLDIKEIKKSDNVAALLDSDDLHEIGRQVLNGYHIDKDSRAEWKSVVDEAMEIAKQVMKKKSFPWPNASNIKFPLISQASIDYASRTLPEIIQNDRVVKTKIVGKDEGDKKYARANRVSKFMSYQLLTESSDWEDGTDKLLSVLPVLGTVFKKTYFDSVEKRMCSEMCVPDKIVVNYNVQSLDKARRVTHELDLYVNDIIERQRMGLYLEMDPDGQEIEPEQLMQVDPADPTEESTSVEQLEDKDRAIKLLEQHCFLDLDGDGYKEPYVVIVVKATGQVLRIVNRFKEVQRNRTGEIKRIIPLQYFTDFHFIRSPDGGFYSMGFGSLLLPINKAINTLINQLIDSGTLNNTQGGLIGRGLRLKNGEIRFKMGKWHVLDAAPGEDIGRNVYPWPTKEPSQTLFSLLGLLMQVGRDLSSTTDVLQGKQPAQNVASSTVSQLVEQGTKVFTAINKRLYRSLKKEYEKVYYLNHEYLDEQDYMRVLDDMAANVKADFEMDNIDIMPVADPALSSEGQRLVRANVMQTLRTADPRAADRYILQSMQVDEETINMILPQADPNAPPPPEVQKTMAEVERLRAEVAKLTADAQVKAQETALGQAKTAKDMEEADARINEAVARVWKMQQDALNNMNKTQIVATKMTSEQELKATDLANKIEKDQADVLLRVKESEKEDKDGSEKG